MAKTKTRKNQSIIQIQKISQKGRNLTDSIINTVQQFNKFIIIYQFQLSNSIKGIDKLSNYDKWYREIH